MDAQHLFWRGRTAHAHKHKHTHTETKRNLIILNQTLAGETKDTFLSIN